MGAPAVMPCTTSPMSTYHQGRLSACVWLHTAVLLSSALLASVVPSTAVLD